MHEALFYQKKDGKKVQCVLCNHRCLISQGQRGICGVRENQKGVLYALTYGKAIASHIDPIEKKPLFHFLPGSKSYSIATIGCNFACKFCQNYDISQYSKFGKQIIGEDLPPSQVVKEAKEANCKSIAYTYTEPTIFFEYAFDTMKLAKKEGILNVWVSNGFMSKEVLDEMDGYLDGINIDLKGFTEDFYQKYCSARLAPVLENLKKVKKMGIWLEITTLIIPTLNDSEVELAKMAKFIKNELGDDMPWHVTAFHPDYLMRNLPTTPAETLIKAREIGLKEGLKYVYSGNIPGMEGENTFCPKCKAKVIKRMGYFMQGYEGGGICPDCGERIAGVF